MSDLKSAARLCGLTEKHRRWGPCPSCGAERFAKDRRPPLQLGQVHWKCWSCRAGGRDIDLAMLHLGLRDAKGRNFHRIRELLGHDALPIDDYVPQEQVYTRANVSEAILGAMPISMVDSPRLSGWLDRRGIRKDAPAGWLENFSADYWPTGKSETYPIVVPCCNRSGNVVSFQGICPETSLKSWPSRADAGGLLFTTKDARKWLAGKTDCPKLIVIVEGVTDFLTAAPHATTIGIASGSVTALKGLSLSPETEIFFGTHLDAGAGRRYQEQVVDALRHPVRRLPFEREDLGERPERGEPEGC